MPNESRTHRFESLDGLRGVFAVAVVLFHASFASHLFALPLVRDAYLSVDFFFVLSGFVIAHAYAGRLRSGAELGEFLVKRIGRVWPLHMVMLAVLVVVEVIKLVVTQKLGINEPSGMPFTGANSPFALLSNIFLLQSLDLHVTTTWNYPAWSISAELCAYVLFALVCLVARRRALRVAASIVIAATFMIVSGSSTGMDLTFHLGAVRGCLGFFLGWLTYAAYLRRPVVSGTPLELALLAVVLAYLWVVGRSAAGFGAPFLFALVIYCIAAGRGIVTRALESRPLQFLGRISYSIYMTHAVVLIGIGLATNLGERLLHRTILVPAAELYGPAFGEDKLIAIGGPWVMDLATLVVVAAVIGISAVTYRTIEEPGRRAFARLASRGQPGHMLPRPS